MKPKQTCPTQRETLDYQLAGINKEITKANRKKCCEKLKISPQTLSNYMNKRISDLDLATDILLFMRAQIASRTNKIVQAA